MEGIAGETLNLSNRNIQSIKDCLHSPAALPLSVASLMIDNNKISCLDGIETFSNLVQLSCRCNRLTDIRALACGIHHLIMINLQNNNITNIQVFDKLLYLQWLCLSGNGIRDCTPISSCANLVHLDLSDNFVKVLPNLLKLKMLKTLLFHGNAIRSLHNMLPVTIETFTIAENNITDLNQFSFLVNLKKLKHLTVMGNVATNVDFNRSSPDYRLFILYFCSFLFVLDGAAVTEFERSQARMLFMDCHGYPFNLGRHKELINYLKTKEYPSSPLANNENHSPNQSTFDTTRPLLLSSITSSTDNKLPSILETLKTLQYVQEMIATQEEIISHHSSFREESSPQKNIALTAIHSGTHNKDLLAIGEEESKSTPIDDDDDDDDDEGASSITIDCVDDDVIRLPHIITSDTSENVILLESKSQYIPVIDNNDDDISIHQQVSIYANDGSDTTIFPQLLSYSIPDSQCGVNMTGTDTIAVSQPVVLGHTILPTSLPTPFCSSFPSFYSKEAHAAVIVIQSIIRGYLCRKENLILKHRAAVKIQASWRGYYCRVYNSTVRAIRDVLYKKKLEHYTVLMFTQLQGCREELAHQIHTIQIQEETLKSLLVEMEELRMHRLNDEKRRRLMAALTIQRYWRNYKWRKISGRALNERSPLISVCVSLQKEVDDLKQTVKILSIRLDQCLNGHHLPPPHGLHLTHHSATCLLIEWSCPINADTIIVTNYRIYINGLLEGTVKAGRYKAYIENLDNSITYRITVRAVYENGCESCDSNPVMAILSHESVNDSVIDNSEIYLHENTLTSAGLATPPVKKVSFDDDERVDGQFDTSLSFPASHKISEDTNYMCTIGDDCNVIHRASSNDNLTTHSRQATFIPSDCVTNATLSTSDTQLYTVTYRRSFMRSLDDRRAVSISSSDTAINQVTYKPSFYHSLEHTSSLINH